MAAVIDDQQFDDRIRLADTELVLNGLGLRAVAWFKGYAAGLYLVQKATSAAALDAMQGPKRLQLKMMVEVEARSSSRPSTRASAQPRRRRARRMADRIAPFDRTVAAIAVRRTT